MKGNIFDWMTNEDWTILELSQRREMLCHGLNGGWELTEARREEIGKEIRALEDAIDSMRPADYPASLLYSASR